MISSSDWPSVIWLEIWNRLPIASLPSPYKSANRQPDLRDRRQNPVDLLRQHERRQMHHDRCPNAGADIRRTARQVTALLVERIIELFFEHIVDLIRQFPSFLI